MRRYNREDIHDKPRASVLAILVAVKIDTGLYHPITAAFPPYNPAAPNTAFLLSGETYAGILDATGATPELFTDKFNKLVELTFYDVHTPDAVELGQVGKGHGRKLTDNPAHLARQANCDLVLLPGNIWPVRVVPGSRFPSDIKLLLPDHLRPTYHLDYISRPVWSDVGSSKTGLHWIHRELPVDPITGIPLPPFPPSPPRNPDKKRSSPTTQPIPSVVVNHLGRLIVNSWSATTRSFTHFPDGFAAVAVLPDPIAEDACADVVQAAFDEEGDINIVDVDAPAQPAAIPPAADARHLLAGRTNRSKQLPPIAFQIHNLQAVPCSHAYDWSPEALALLATAQLPLPPAPPAPAILWPIIPASARPRSPSIEGSVRARDRTPSPSPSPHRRQRTPTPPRKQSTPTRHGRSSLRDRRDSRSRSRSRGRSGWNTWRPGPGRGRDRSRSPAGPSRDRRDTR